METIDFIRIYARCWNQLSFLPLEPYLSENVRYDSQASLGTVRGKENVIKHLADRVADAKEDHAANDVRAEIGYCGNEDYQPVWVWGMEGEPCVLIFIGNRNDPVGLTILDVDRECNLITGIDVCTISPNPQRAIRTGEYPE